MNIKTGCVIAAAAVFVLSFWIVVLVAALSAPANEAGEENATYEVMIDGKWYPNVNVSIMPTTMGENSAISVGIGDKDTNKWLMDFNIHRDALIKGEHIDWEDWQRQGNKIVSVMIQNQRDGEFPFFDLVNHEQVKEVRMVGEVNVSNLGLLTLKLDGVAATAKREYGEVVWKRLCPFNVNISMVLNQEQADIIWKMKPDLSP